MIDTVIFITPKIPKQYIEKISRKFKIYNCFDCATGDLEYQVTSGNLEGSYDNKISVRVNSDQTLKISCSLHKLIVGHNIYSGSDDLRLQANILKKVLQDIFKIKLPNTFTWTVKQIDYALVFDLGDQWQVKEYIASLREACYARRQIQVYGNNGIHIPGKTTTVKFYNKYEEFKKHDHKKIEKLYYSKRENIKKKYSYQTDNEIDEIKRKKLEKQELDAIPDNERPDILLEKSKGLIRIEVAIKTRKINDTFKKTRYKKQCERDYLTAAAQFGNLAEETQYYLRRLKNTNQVTIREIKINEIKNIWDKEVSKVIKENQIKDTIINTSTEVIKQLDDRYNKRTTSALYGFWTLLSTKGEEHAKNMYPNSTFYRYRDYLVKAGITWRNTDVKLIDNSNVIKFVPRLDSKYLYNLNQPDLQFKTNMNRILGIAI